MIKIRLRDMEMWTVVKDVLADVEQFRDLALSERWTCHRYGPGGVLKPHQDGTKFDSVYSVLVYLNDDFSGGRTTFLSKPDAEYVTSCIDTSLLQTTRLLPGPSGPQVLRDVCHLH